MTTNVLYLNSIPYMGGSERSLLSLMSHLDRTRFRPYLVTGAEGMLSAQTLDQGIPVAVQSFPGLSRRRPWIYAGAVWRLIQTIRDNDIALVHTNCDRGLSHVNRASRLTGVPYVSHVRDFIRSWFYPQHLAALNRARRVIANSKAIAGAFVQAGVRADLVEVVYNPVDVARFSQVQPDAGVALRHSLGISPDAFVVGLVGQVQPIKGQEELIEAAANVVKSVPGVHFLITGEVFLEPQQMFLRHLKALVEQLGLDGCVHFTGFRDDIPVVMQALDILVVPSQPQPRNPRAGEGWEEPHPQTHQRLRQIGFGRVVVEGMAARRAVIATELDGMVEILEHGRNGLLVPPGDVGALADAVILLAKDRNLRGQIADGGRQTAQRFTPEIHAGQIQLLYDAVLKRMGSG